MNIIFFIRSTNKDNKKLVNLRIRVTAGRDVNIYAKTLISVHPDHWSNETQNYRQRADIKNLEQKKKQLKDLRSYIEDAFNLKKNKDEVSSTWLAEAVNKFHNPNLYLPGQPISFIEFIEDFINKSKVTSNSKTGRIVCYKQQREYARTLHYFKAFCASKDRTYDFKDIDLHFYDDFKAYMHSVTIGKKKLRAIATNTIGKKIQTLKVFLNYADSRGFAVNQMYKNKDFAAIREESESVYLDVKELTALYNLDLSATPWKNRVRDLFLIGAWTGLRFGDYYQVTPENIIDNKLIIKQSKTEGVVVIPLHPIVKAILEKYGYKLPRVISNQKFNTTLKEIAKQAKFNSDEHKGITRGGIRVSQKYKKWELISTHTARRSFATNLYKSKFPSISIMKITGHKSEAAFLKYIKVTPDEHARMLEDHWNQQGSNLMVV